MEILEAFDLTGSLRDAGELAGCSHHTVARYVAAREEGRLAPGAPVARGGVVDGFLPKIEEWVEASRGKIRADVAHEKLVAMGFTGSERTTRRAVARVKEAWRAGHRRVHRPWIPEPGLWAQYDFGDGPVVGRARTWLFCFWLAWSRYRVVIPLLDKTSASVFAAIDAALRSCGGVATYLLTDNEKTVTIEHVAGIAVRNPATVAFGRHYGLTVATCVPYDPQTKGGSEATVRIAKADLVPTAANLLPAYRSLGEFEAACERFTDEVNARVHRVTRRAPAEMLLEELRRLHPLPAQPYTAAFGTTRTVPAHTPMVSFEGGQYSVPDTLTGATVWVRRHGEQVVIVHVHPVTGPVEVARHAVTTPGNPRVDQAHFPPAPAGALGRAPKARTGAESAFLAIGEGAGLWLAEAAAAGTTRIRVKMAAAVELAALHGPTVVDRALGQAAAAGRFDQGDLAAILTHQATAMAGPVHRASDAATLAQGTTAWAGYGARTSTATSATTPAPDKPVTSDQPVVCDPGAQAGEVGR